MPKAELSEVIPLDANRLPLKKKSSISMKVQHMIENYRIGFDIRGRFRYFLFPISNPAQCFTRSPQAMFFVRVIVMDPKIL